MADNIAGQYQPFERDPSRRAQEALKEPRDLASSNFRLPKELGQQQRRAHPDFFELRGSVFHREEILALVPPELELTHQIADKLAKAGINSPIIVGRAPDTLRLVTFSRSHVIVTDLGDSTFRVADAHSTNGSTYLRPGMTNQWREFDHHPVILPVGTLIRCGTENTPATAWFQLTSKSLIEHYAKYPNDQD